MTLHARSSRVPRHLSCLAIGFIFCIAGVFAQTPIFFEEYLTKRFSNPTDKEQWTVERLCPVTTSVVARRVLSDYGALFAAHDSVIVPATCIFPGEAPVQRYQASLVTDVVPFGNVRISLQRSAGEKLRIAIADAQSAGANITPLDGEIAGSRTFGQTLMLWNSRYIPGLEFWIKRGKLTETDRNEIAALELPQKIEKVLEWESRGILFSTNRTRSILTSTAPPGASQHLAMLAFDVVEYADPRVQGSLNRNGWFQTIVDDPPHFTFLGVSESELPSRGLQPVWKGAYKYWIPHLSPRGVGPQLPTN